MQISRYDALYLKDFFSAEEPEELKDVAPEPEEIPEPEPITFSEEERNAAFEEGKKEGLAAGYEKGYAEAKDEMAKHAEQVGLAVKAMSSTLDTMHSTYQLELNNQLQQSQQLAMMVARKVADASLDKNAPAMMAAMLERAMPMMLQKPHLVIEVHPDILEEAHLQLQMVIEREGFEGSTQMQPNSNLDKYDIRIDWNTGSAARSIDDLWAELDDIMQRFQPSSPETTTEE